MEEILERTIGRIQRDVAQNSARIQKNADTIAENTAHRRLWSSEAVESGADRMEASVERLHSMLVGEEERLMQWVDAGRKTSMAPLFTKRGAAVVALLLGVGVYFKDHVFKATGGAVAEVTAVAIADPVMVGKVQSVLVAIGKSPETVDALTDLIETVFHEKQTLDALTKLLKGLLAKDDTKDAFEKLFKQLFATDSLKRSGGEFVVQALEQKEIKAKLQLLILAQLTELLDDPKTHHAVAKMMRAATRRALWSNAEPDEATLAAEIADEEKMEESQRLEERRRSHGSRGAAAQDAGADVDIATDGYAAAKDSG